MSQPQPTPLHKSSPHESAVGHVTGRARYVDDLPEPLGLAHAAVVTSPVAAGRIVTRSKEAALAVPGVLGVFFADDIPGDNRIGPIVHDEPLLAEDEVHFCGQSVALVVAETRAAAREAAALVAVTIDAAEPLLDFDAAMDQGSFTTEAHVIARGDVAAALDGAHLLLEGEARVGYQDHFYLETQGALAVPQEGGVHIVSSTQHPTEVQREAARILGLPAAAVVCEVPRLGGGFGGKESQASPYACLAALGAVQLDRPVKLVLKRHEDMAWTGNRHPFIGRYRAGFAKDGTFVGFEARIYSNGGWSTDLSGAVMDRALFHLDNAYRIDHVRFEGRVVRTNLPSNTAFRGFGGPQGVAVVEDALERAAAALDLDPVEIRRRNYYVDGDACPYGQVLSDVRLQRVTDELLDSADYAERRAAIDAFNASSRWVKRGIGFAPVKFGISFTASLLNQAGALVLVYSDGSVQLNHGGTEMGQGLYTKMRAVAADTLGVPTKSIRHMNTATDKVPNTSATAASSGTDLNGAAVRAACETVRERMRPVAAELLGCAEEEVRFASGLCHGPEASVPFAEVANQCWVRQISLSSTGFYATPGIAYDPAEGRGTPFFYYAYGAALTEVEVDGRTGEHGVRRVDILHDVGDSLVPSIDLGQVEGGYVQGLGWLTVEEMLYDEAGRTVTHGPSTYKIPAVGDVPPDFRVALLDRAPQPGVIGGSKAVGEPPFLLAFSAVGALRHAVAAYGDGEVALGLPATHESVLRAITAVKGER